MRIRTLRTAGVVLVLAVTVGACGGKKSAAKLSASGSATTAGLGLGTSDTTALVAGGTTTPTNAPGANKGATPTAPKAGSPAPSLPPATVAPGGNKAAPGVNVGAAPGKYTMTGSATRTAGVTSTTQSSNFSMTITYDKPAGADQHYASEDQGGQTTHYTLRYQPDGAYLVDLKTLGKEFTPNPPVLVFPASAPANKSWSWTITSTDNSTTVASTNTVGGTETLTIGGTAVPCTILNISQHITGNFNNTPFEVKQTITRDYDGSLNLVVKDHSLTEVVQPAAYASKIDSTGQLSSVKPA